jgi:hypothetical protein
MQDIRFIVCSLFTVLVLAAGCSKAKPPVVASTDSSKVQDWRHGASDICPVHHVTMSTEVVHGLAGVIDPTPAYGDARSRLFPHAGIDYGPDMYRQDRGMIYVCPSCVQARKKWRKEHP